jgi:hypothetical protein
MLAFAGLVLRRLDLRAADGLEVPGSQGVLIRLVDQVPVPAETL